MPRIRLLARCQINGALHESGDVVFIPDGQRGPHKTRVVSSHGAEIATNRYHGDAEPDANYTAQDLYDEPLFVVLDDGIENEREEMIARHGQELAAHDADVAREEIVTRQARERAEIDLRAQEAEIKARQTRETEALKMRQDTEQRAFDKNDGSPVDGDKEAMQKRHQSETEHLEVRHAEENRQFESRKKHATEQMRARDGKAEVEQPAAKPSNVPLIEDKSKAPATDNQIG